MSSKEPLPFERRIGAPPPKDIAPSELVRRLTERPRPHKVLPWIRKDPETDEPLASFALTVLTQEELDDCRANAARHTEAKIGKLDDGKVNQEAWRELYDSARAVEMVFASCRKPDDLSATLFDAPSQIRRLLTADEVVLLFNAYDNYQRETGPLFKELSGEEIDTWIDVLTKGAEHYPFELLPPGAAIQLLLSLANEVAAWRIGSASSSPPSSASMQSGTSPSEPVTATV